MRFGKLAQRHFRFCGPMTINTLSAPRAVAIRNKKCVKGCSGILNEEHIIKCMHGPEKHEIHTQFALVINDMMKHAGCATVLELRCLVPGDGERRHTDVLAKGVAQAGRF